MRAAPAWVHALENPTFYKHENIFLVCFGLLRIFLESAITDGQMGKGSRAKMATMAEGAGLRTQEAGGV